MAHIDTHTIDWNRLLDILSLCRCAGSKGEQQLIDRYIKSIKGIYQDDYGNLMVKLGESTTMFSCHTDTVHMSTDPIRQDLGLIEEDGTLCVMNDKHVLGADDGAGIEIMLTMIDNQIPGLYVFHREEERGGRGSSYLSRRTDLYEGVNRCIAFDRKGTADVITHQASGRGCSQEFAHELSDRLNALDAGFKFRPDDSGLFTDSDNYTTTIPECTNLSVGYEAQHTNNETLDVLFLDRLTAACLLLDWESLPTKRDPSVVEYDKWGSSYYGNSYSSEWDKLPAFFDWHDALTWVMDNPEKAADLIFDLADSSGYVIDDYNSDGITLSQTDTFKWSDS